MILIPVSEADLIWEQYSVQSLALNLRSGSASFEVKCLKSEDRTLFRLNLLIDFTFLYKKMYNF